MFFVIVVYRFHTIKFTNPYLLYTKQGSNPQGDEIIRIDIQMKGKGVWKKREHTKVPIGWWFNLRGGGGVN